MAGRPTPVYQNAQAALSDHPIYMNTSVSPPATKDLSLSSKGQKAQPAAAKAPADDLDEDGYAILTDVNKPANVEPLLTPPAPTAAG